MKTVNQKNNYDKRTKPRKLYSGHIFFTSKNGFHEGRLKNFSRNGLFIETKACLSVGEIISISLPHIKGKEIKRKGQIMWCNKDGCGIELFRKRSTKNFRINK